MSRPYILDGDDYDLSGSVYTAPEVSETDYFADNGQTEPLYSTNNPMAVYDSVSNATYVTYHGPDFDPYVTKYDHTAGTWGQTVQAGTNPIGKDDHGAPIIFVDDGGYLHVVHGSHNTPFEHAKSTRPHDHTAWSDEGQIGSYATYGVGPGTAPNGSLYLFYRRTTEEGTATPRPFSVFESTDGGATWGSYQDAVYFDNRAVYPGDATFDGSDIHLVWNHAPSAGLERYDVYHAIYDTEIEEVRTVSGYNAGTTLDRTEADNNDALAYDSGSEYALLPRVKVDNNGNPHIVYNHRLGTDSYEYRYLYLDGSAWTTPTAITTTTSSDNPAMDFTSPSDITVYLSSTDGSADDIEEWHYDGSSWSQVQVVLNHETFGKNLQTAHVPTSNDPECRVIFGEHLASDYSTPLKVFAHGDSGLLGRESYALPASGGGTNTWPANTRNAWPFDEGSGTTVADAVGSAGGTVNGATWVSGTWLGDAALDGDGSSDYVELTTLGDYGSRFIDEDFWVAVTIQTSSGDADIMGTRDTYVTRGTGSGNRFLRVGVGTGATDTSYPILLLADADARHYWVEAQTSVTDGAKHRLVFNKITGDGVNSEIYIDGNSAATNVVRNDDVQQDSSDFINAIYTHAYNDRTEYYGGSSPGSLFTGTVDNPIFGQLGTTLSSQEVTDDYNRQPWS